MVSATDSGTLDWLGPLKRARGRSKKSGALTPAEKQARCRSIARDGIYNPFRKPLDRAVVSARRVTPGDKGRGTDVAVDATAEDAGGYWPKATIPQSYSPPQHQIATGMN